MIAAPAGGGEEKVITPVAVSQEMGVSTPPTAALTLPATGLVMVRVQLAPPCS